MTSVLELTDADGMTMRNALAEFGADAEHIAAEAYHRADVLGYLEVHIEQGPVLEQAGEPLGVVSAIASQGRYRLQRARRGRTCRHRAHGGAPRCAGRRRRDDPGDRAGGEEGRQSVAGRHRRRDQGVSPGASNVIPGQRRVQPRPARRRRRGARRRRQRNPRRRPPDRHPPRRRRRHRDGPREAGRGLRAAPEAGDRRGDRRASPAPSRAS